MSTPCLTTETPLRSTDELRTLATQAADHFAEREAQGIDPVALAHEVVEWATTTFGGKVSVTSSMADGVLAHLAGSHRPGIDVLFLDTGYHFMQTIGVRNRVARDLPVTVRTLEPELTVAEQDEQYGKDLFSRDPNACCDMRKVAPLNAALSEYEGWMSGLRRADSYARRFTALIAFDEKRGKIKINPLAAWSDEDVDAYIAQYDIPVNPLLDQGFTSIGCYPCTSRPEPGQDLRAGRWAGSEKTECGIHV